jgi:5'-nucleotidase
LSYEGAKGITPVGGAAYLAAVLKQSRTNASIAVAAGDLISASPLTSSLFYDEPTIDAMTQSGLALASVGNHEFDRGIGELKRMQAGGCIPNPPSEARKSCIFAPFKGAGFQYLSANVVGADGQTLFPATAIRDVGGVKIGFIGETLKETKQLVSPDGVRGVDFTDEAATANALVPALKAQGAQVIVLLIHQGGAIDGKYDDQTCPGLTGDILPILDKLSPEIPIVVSGHTHNAYICHLPMAGGGARLLTSSGKYGAMITDIRLTIGADGKLAGDKASFIEVQGEPIVNGKSDVPLNPNVPTFAADPQVAAMVKRYHDAAASTANRPVGYMPVVVPKRDGLISPASALISDGQLFVARAADKGQADFALMNPGGARTDLVPGDKGLVTYGMVFAMQPFANALVTKTFTGAQVKEVLEQDFPAGSVVNVLMPSANFSYAFDRSKPAGQRILWMKLNGKRLDLAKRYRVTVNNFLASGGDGFTKLIDGTDPVDGGLDVKATEAWLATRPAPPKAGRVVDLTPKDWKPAA